jgi:hypothetical protein
MSERGTNGPKRTRDLKEDTDPESLPFQVIGTV